jgi:hypothetical protein
VRCNWQVDCVAQQLPDSNLWKVTEERIRYEKLYHYMVGQYMGAATGAYPEDLGEEYRAHLDTCANHDRYWECLDGLLPEASYWEMMAMIKHLASHADSTLDSQEIDLLVSDAVTRGDPDILYTGLWGSR